MNGQRSLRVGRGVDCEIRLEDDTVSRVHALLQQGEGGRLVVLDQSSSNGTFVRYDEEWRRIERAELDPDATVRFGEREVKLREVLVAVPGFIRTDGSPPATLLPARIDWADPGPRFERPRRNPRTGDIEDQS